MHTLVTERQLFIFVTFADSLLSITNEKASQRDLLMFKNSWLENLIIQSTWQRERAQWAHRAHGSATKMEDNNSIIIN